MAANRPIFDQPMESLEIGPITSCGDSCRSTSAWSKPSGGPSLRCPTPRSPRAHGAARPSYFDTAAPAPERFYHGFVVGLLTGLGSRYEIRSNRESGLGRCDVMVLPRIKGDPGVVLELKRVDTEAGETVEKASCGAAADPGAGLRGGAEGAWRGADPRDGGGVRWQAGPRASGRRTEEGRAEARTKSKTKGKASRR